MLVKKDILARLIFELNLQFCPFGKKSDVESGSKNRIGEKNTRILGVWTEGGSGNGKLIKKLEAKNLPETRAARVELLLVPDL